MSKEGYRLVAWSMSATHVAPSGNSVITVCGKPIGFDAERWWGDDYQITCDRCKAIAEEEGLARRYDPSPRNRREADRG